MNRWSSADDQADFVEYGHPKKIVSDVGTNFTSDQLKDFCRKMNIQQAITSSYPHQINGQVEACIKFVKHTIKMLWY